MIYRDKAKRDRAEQPVEIWQIDHQPSGALHWGVTYSDGEREQLFIVDGTRFVNADAMQDAILAALESFGLDISHIAAEKRRREREAQHAEFERQYHARLDEIKARIWRQFMDDGGYAAFEPGAYGFFREQPNPFAPGFTPRGSPPADPERVSALDKCRKLKATAASTTFPGEKAAADNRRASIMAKHGIGEHEI